MATTITEFGIFLYADVGLTCKGQELITADPTGDPQEDGIITRERHWQVTVYGWKTLAGKYVELRRCTA